jgi:hypothetical protein
MKVEQVTKTYVPPKCRHIGCKCRSNRRDSWIVKIPEIHDQVQIGSLQMHGFVIFPLIQDASVIFDLVTKSIPHDTSSWEYIQSGPPSDEDIFVFSLVFSEYISWQKQMTLVMTLP